MRIALVVLALCASLFLACGGSQSELPPDTLNHDSASSFGGRWYGTGTTTVSGRAQQSTGYIDVSVTGRNALAFSSFCDGSGPAAQVTSDTTFTIGSHSCTKTLSTCAMNWQFTGGAGTLIGGTFAFSLSGTVSGCELSATSVNLSFSGVRSQATPTSGTTDHGPPSATVVSQNVEAQPGVPVVLDASGSSDPDSRTLTFSWTVTQKPTDGDATLSNPTTAQASFKATVQGSYAAQVTVTASDGQSATAIVNVKVSLPGQAITALSHEVLRADYSRGLDRVVMIDDVSPALYVYDPTSGAESKVVLPLSPQCLSVSPDGLYAVVGHNAWISYIDLAGATLVKTIPVTMNVGECVLAGNGWAYLLPGSYYSVPLHSVQLATGLESSASYSFYSGTRARLHPGGGRMYIDSSGYLERWDVSSGAAVHSWNAPYSNYSIGSNLWISDDGSRIFTSTGTAFRTDATQAADMIYGGALAGMSLVKHMDSCSTEIAAIPDVSWSTPNADTAVELLTPDYLAYKDRITLPNWAVGASSYPTHGRCVFYSADSSKKYVIVQADAASGLTNDTAVLTY